MLRFAALAVTETELVENGATVPLAGVKDNQSPPDSAAHHAAMGKREKDLEDYLTYHEGELCGAAEETGRQRLEQQGTHELRSSRLSPVVRPMLPPARPVRQ